MTKSGHITYICHNCNREVAAVFYIGKKNDIPRWACDICVTRQKMR